MLYHSFPGRYDAEQPDKDIQVLDNILKYGLLLAADIAPYPGKTDENGNVISGEIKLLQCHFCLTAIDDPELLKAHTKTYGEFILEFDNENMYEIGAIPVMYVPKAPSAGAATTSLWHLAATFLHRLEDLRTITAALEYLDEATGDFASIKKITVNSDTGKKKKINRAQLRGILELILDGVINVRDSKERKKKDFAQIQGAIQSLWPLFNFTDDPPEKIKENEDYPYLKSFREREWRIVPGMSINGKVQDRILTFEERKDIIAVDSNFFGAKLDKVINGRKPQRIDLCRILPSINGKPIQSFINRIYVPKERYKEALAMVKKNKCRIEKNGFSTDRIISYDKEQGIPNNQEGAISQRC